MSGPSAPNTSITCSPNYKRFLADLDPRNIGDSGAPSTRNESTRRWWQRAEAATKHCSVVQASPWTAEDTDKMFADLGQGDAVPPPVEMLVGYVADERVPAWVSTVDITTADLYRFGRFFKRGYAHVRDAADSNPAWWVEPAAEWFLRDYLAQHHESITDSIVSFFRRRSEESRNDDSLDGLVAGDSQPTVGVTHDALGIGVRVPDGTP